MPILVVTPEDTALVVRVVIFGLESEAEDGEGKFEKE